ncbi:tubulin-tyrosine ligase protein [Rutstroemia sp. NJR-2017a BVV2]|nr:tubulin-tyrosine ligase protein [Rutstroemia sp. NJR-2017a BVV2]
MKPNQLDKQNKIIRKPLNLATSKPAQKTYLNTILLLSTSAVLFGFAVVAYVIFYWNWVPAVGVEKDVWLVFEPGTYPHALVPLDNSLLTRQEYSISLTLHLPRSPTNLAAGNFMVGVKVLSPSYKPALPASSSTFLPPTPPTSARDPGVLFQQRRPVLMRYESRVVGLASRIINLPWYILGLKKESDLVRVEMTSPEGVTFPRGKGNVPSAVEVWVEREEVQVYGMKVVVRARLSGLRWWMWNWRVGSAVVGVGTFWGLEMLGVLVGWGVLRLVFDGEAVEETGRGGKKGKEIGWERDMDGDEVETDKVKEEATDDEPDLSDTPRTFPTTGRQMPLVYPPVGIKKEEDEEESKALEETVILPLGGDADDEDEDGEESWKVEGRRSDSGLGTSYSEAGSSRLGRVTRRRSRGGSANGL